jgi:hypothetical protein
MPRQIAFSHISSTGTPPAAGTYLIVGSMLGNVVYLVDVLLANGLYNDTLDVLVPCGGGRLNFVEQVQKVMFMWMIKEESVCVFIPNVVHQGHTPQFGPWALPPFENGFCQFCDLGGGGIVEIDLLVIIDCGVASFDHFDSTEEGVAHEGRENVDTASRFPQIVVQLVDHSCCCHGSI